MIASTIRNCSPMDRRALGVRLAVALLALVAYLLWPEPAAAFESWWVQNHQETELWSGPDSRAVSFGRVPQWSYFQVVAPQNGPRLFVFNPMTDNYAYIDASAVGPSGRAPGHSARKLPAETQGGKEAGASAARGSWWVSNYRETELWAGAEEGAPSLGKVPQFRRFLVVEPQNGDRLKVWSPEKDQVGYLEASAVGPSGPSVWVSSHPTRPLRRVGLPGRSLGDKAYLRSLPVHDDETELRQLPHNTAVVVKEAVATSDGREWYLVEGGGYILASEVRLPRPVERSHPGRWIDADLAEPTMVTAYEGDRVVFSAMAIRGISATPTPEGTFEIVRRVSDETMDSETIGIPRDSPHGYLLKNVLYTQYFTADGAALHYNYWLGKFGYAGSHGCLGLNLKDARWLWDWAKIGTTVVVRGSESSDLVVAVAGGG